MATGSIATPPTRPSPAVSPPAAPRSAAPPPPSIDFLRLARSYWPWLVAAGILGIIVGVAAYRVLRSVAPQYTSYAYIEVQPARRVDSAVNVTTDIGGKTELEIAMGTSANIATSDPILLRAAEQPGVRQTAWAQRFVINGVYAPGEALAELRKIVRARVYGQTNFIEVTARAPSPVDAQAITQAIVEVFIQSQSLDSRSNVSGQIQLVERDLRRLRTSLDAINARINNLIDQDGLTTGNEGNSIYAQEIGVLQPLVAAIRQQIASSSEQLEKYQEMMQAPGGVVYPEMIRSEAERSPVAANLLLQIESAEASLRSFEAQFGPNHPERRKRVLAIQGLRDQREEHIQRKMAETFAVVIDSMTRNIDTLRAAEAEHLEKIAGLERKLNELVRSLTTRRNLEAERNSILASIQETEKVINSMSLERERGARVRLNRPPTLPDSMSFPKLIPTVAVSVFLIGGAVSGLIFLREITEQRIRTPLDVSIGARARVLGFIPDISMDPSAPKRIELACEEAPRGATAEAIRQIRSSLLKSARENGQKAILFVSGLPGSGTTSIVSNLGINIANIDLKVLLIDANLRRPSLHKVFGTGDKPGLAEILRDGAALDQCIVQTRIPNLSVLPAGSDGDGTYERFNTPAMSDLISHAREKYDFIFIDVAPSVVAGDALALSHRVDAVTLVVRAYSEKRGLLSRMKSQMEDARASVLGVIVNAIRPNAGGYFKKNFQATIAYQSGSTSSQTKDAKPVKASSPEIDNNTNA